ncbi:hypothetical protein DH2020_048265 [Rehmannia glutinosa]|uniref:F-box domain-containing protein n=1 Tax=Rehmannia glutinosa TaxID=99300 RepID=A0ABR0U6C0_REHGL
MTPIRTESPEKIKEPIAANAMANCVLHDDIMLCILARLPVKSILRFRSVCKPWCELFSTPHFVKMHHGQFSSDPKNQSFIICSKTAKFCTTASLLNIESNEKKPTIIDYPYPYINNRPKSIVGCYNGLICLNDCGITMWNPAMNLSKSIQLSNAYFGGFERVSLGFGYDAKGADFKVVRIVNFLEMSIAGVEVYSVNSDSWRTIEVDFQFRVLRTTCDVIVNGNPYWLAKSDHGEVLVCFDVTKLVFKIVSLSSLSLKEGGVTIG